MTVLVLAVLLYLASGIAALACGRSARLTTACGSGGACVTSLIGMFPAVNGYFFIPNYGTIIAAIQFDRSGTTHIGKYLLNHSFMLPGLICTVGAVAFGLLIGKFLF